MASLIYTNATKLIGDGTVDWDNGGHTYRVLLVTPTYSIDVDGHVFVSHITNELSGTGYVRKDLANRAVTVDNANNRSDYKADNVTWTAITAANATAALAIVFKFVTNDADSPLIAAIDFPDTIMNGGDFQLKWDGQASNGTLFRLAAV